MHIPASTYRLQINPEFTFKEVQEILDYLVKLHVGSVYSAPFFQAMEGSTHGYDVIDPLKINPAIGSLEEFRQIREILQQNGMGWLQDIVPNHMANSPANPWIKSILEHGPDSPFYGFFDINWNHKEWAGKVMAPFLGGDFDTIFNNGEFKLIYREDGFAFQYYDNIYPASVASYAFILSHGKKKSWSSRLERVAGDEQEWQQIKADFYTDVQEKPDLKNEVGEILADFNQSEKLMKQLLNRQFFVPVHWKESEKKINFRRFFTINDLICLRMEDDKVFDAYHKFIHQLCKEGLITGLRIDHIDGLFDPKGYLKKLNELLDDDFYIIIEKILEPDESLTRDWKTQGTSGYDFLGMVNNLFTKGSHKEKFRKHYNEIKPSFSDYSQLVYDKKQFILHERMGGELQNLWSLLEEHSLLPEENEMSKESGMQALSALLAAFPVYRIYPKAYPLSQRQLNMIDIAYNGALEQEPALRKELEYFRQLFVGEGNGKSASMRYFLQRCQQFTGPLAAKGVEDTTFYLYNQLVSHNEVGDSPEVFGISTMEFHDLMKKRLNEFPHTINATSTHDTKRGEDSRMRLNVLSEIPREWFEKVEEWHRINQGVRKKPDVPDRNEEYFIYQSLIGAMGFGEDIGENFLQRTHDFLQKVLREAKEHSFWSDPNVTYEEDVAEFIKDILSNEEFRASFDPFREKVSFFGVINSLGQSLIKITAPGIPDIYQGTELWDLSYVDPDNRRPVDYELRKSYLKEFEQNPDGMDQGNLNLLMDNYADGKIKMYTLYRALRERRLNPELFQNADYIPLQVSSGYNDKVISYAREHQGQWYIIALPLFTTSLCQAGNFPLGKAWSEGYLDLPPEAPQRWKNVFSGDTLSTEGQVAISQLFADFPVCLLKSEL
jgi:(1->4)-alpha-D-glucan 1-alpha-D-glucosylmutase